MTPTSQRATSGTTRQATVARNPGWRAIAALAGIMFAAAGAFECRAQQQPAAPPQGQTPAQPAATAPAPGTTPAGASKAAPARKPNRAVQLDLDILLEKVARYPDNPYLINEVGNQLLRHGRRKDAEERFEKAVKLDPQFAAGWNNLGVARMSLDKKTEAASAYRKAIKIQPNYALAWYNLGVVLDRQNRYEEALKAYETAFVLDPDLLDVKKNPQVAANNRLAAVMSQTYIDRGGTVVFPLESSYPEK